MLDIGFVVAGGRKNFKPFRNQPLAELHLLTIIEENFKGKVNLSLIDLRGIDEDNTIYYIPEKDVYMFSIYTPEYNESVDVLKSIRAVYPDAKHIGGGPHVNIFPDEMSLLFDAIVLGEGEKSIITAINDILSNNLQPVYNQEGSVDINSYPYPLRKFLPKTAVVEDGLLVGEHSSLEGTAVLFSRGCPFKCHFCANLTFGSVRFRSPKLIEDEIEYLKKEYQIEALALKDDNGIPINVKDAEPFLTAIGNTGIKWRGQSRASGVKTDMVKLAKEAGCTDIAIGLESISERALKLVHKGLRIDNVRKYIDTLKKIGLGVRLHFIIGLPGEPDNIVEETLQFVEQTQPSSVLLSLLCPLPGSPLYMFPEKYGIKNISNDWEKFRVVFGGFDPKELPEMVFEYEKITPWGKSMSNKTILQNYVDLQNTLREGGLKF